ncbi:MAG: glutamate--tRNA ligase [Candidatus Uhrbacteria bacterium]
MTVRTRFAPSPTGYLHIGSLRTALYCYFFARKHNGTFVLRIEDTDQTRFVPGSMESLIQVLKHMAITIDEGPTLNEKGLLTETGEFGPYIQSNRTEIYREHAKVLLDKGAAYYCFCSSEHLDTRRKEQEAAKLPTKYDRACLKLTPEEIQTKLAAGEKYVIRLHVPDGETEFDDLVHGHVKFSNKEIDDQVLIKSDGFPTYHLANVVDDHLMNISHVIRGDEWLSSVPKHIVLYKAFDWTPPAFAHLPLILNADHSKLSKRQGDVAVEDYLKKGYLPEALNNFIAICGFNPKGDQEIYSLQELIDLFDIEKVNKSGAIFDKEKLNWMNSQYIHRLSVDDLTDLCLPYVVEVGKTIEASLLKKICTVERERLVLLSDIVEKIDSYLKLPDYQPEILVWKKSSKEEALVQLENIKTFIEAQSEENLSSTELVETAIRGYIESNGLQNGAVLWPLRAALSGSTTSPSPFELIWVLDKDESLNRIKQAIEKLLSTPSSL